MFVNELTDLMSYVIIALCAYGFVELKHTVVELEYAVVLVQLEYTYPAVFFWYEYSLRIHF